MAEAAAAMRAGRPELVCGFSHCPEHGKGLLFRGQLFIYLREDRVDRRVPLRKHKGSFAACVTRPTINLINFETLNSNLKIDLQFYEM